MAFDAGSIIAHLKLDTAGFQSGAKEAESSANAGGLSMGKLAAGVALGQAAFMAAQAAISSVTGALKSTVTTAEDYGATVMKLHRDTGLATDEASKLAFAFHSVGIDGDTAAGMMVKFDKQVAAAADPVGKQSAALTALGVNVRDASGHMKGMTDILGDTADKINAMGSQEEKVAEVTKLFGRSGEPMLKFLALGKQGMAEVEAEATKYGLVLSENNVDAVQKYITAHREWDAAMEGIKLKIGLAVMPALTSFTKMLTDLAGNPMVQDWAKKIGEALSKMATIAKTAFSDAATFIRMFFDTITGGDPTLKKGEEKFAGLARAMSELMPAIQQLGQAAQQLWGYLMQLWNGIGGVNGIMNDLAAVGKMVLGAFNFLLPSIEQLWSAITTKLWPSIDQLIKVLAPILVPLLKDMAIVAGVVLVAALFVVINVITGVARALGFFISWIAAAIGWVEMLGNFINGIIGGIAGVVMRAFAPIESAMTGPFQRAYNAIAGIINAIKNTVSGVGQALHNAHIPGFAAGVQNFSGGVALVGESGPELVQLPQGANVIPNNQLSSAMNGGGVHLKVEGDLNVGSDYDTDQFMARIQRNIELQRQGGSAI